MRAGYLDTSALVAVAFDEPNAARLAEQLHSFDELLSSTLLESEFLSMAEREGVRNQAATLLESITWIFPNRRLTQELNTILNTGFLRGAELHHLSTALHLFPNPEQAFFLTLDVHQRDIAHKLGFNVIEL